MGFAQPRDIHMCKLCQHSSQDRDTRLKGKKPDDGRVVEGASGEHAAGGEYQIQPTIQSR